jgi:hypothetical protein
MARPWNIRVKVICMSDTEKLIKDLFFDILNDYSNRLSAPITEKKTDITITMVHHSPEDDSAGVVFIADDKVKIMILIRDPLLNEWEPNPYTVSKFVTVLCHEIIHACQAITGRKGFRIPRAKVNKKDLQEVYFFDPEEVEARALSEFYTYKYGKTML